MPQEQEQKRIQRRGDGAPPAGAETETAKAASKGQELTDEMDEILDEIDTVLEQNAEEFVKSYVQKGGE